MNIIYDNTETINEDILNKMQAGAKHACELEGIPEERVEISLTIVEKDEIQQINRDFRGIDKVTDVLSFPQFEADEEVPEDGEIILGDVVICKEKAQEQAQEFGHSFEREIVYLFIHSICHLLGYDHEEDDEKAVMREREEEIMDFLGIPRS